MFRLLRAGGFAAAAFFFAANTVVANPSVASEADLVPITSSLVAHATATLDAAAPAALTPAEQAASKAALTHDIDFSTPVMQHAIAPVAPAPVLKDEAAPAAAGKLKSLSALIDDFASSEAADEELECLAEAVYFESRGEPIEGQLAVAEVVLNRAASGRFPTSICGVVKQKSQFSFVRGGVIPEAPRNADWRRAVAIARIAKDDLADSAGSRALFFHARYVRPGWRGVTRVASVGNHIFYR